MSRDAAECPRIAVVYGALEEATTGGVHHGRRDVVPQRRVRCIRIELCTEHAERPEDLLGGELIERLTRDAFDHCLEEHHVPVAVDHGGAGHALEWSRIDLCDVLSAAAI